MLFLFNDVYLTLDKRMHPGADHVMISPVAQKLPTDPFELAITQIDIGHTIASGTSLDEVLADTREPGTLLEKLAARTKPTYIYADGPNYIKVACAWFKSMLPNLTAETAHQLLTVAITKTAHTLGYPYAVAAWMTPAAAADYSKLVYLVPTAADFPQYWNQIPVLDFGALTKSYFDQRCGVEWQLATYLMDPNWEHTGILREKVKKMMLKQQHALFQDAVRGILFCPEALPGFDRYNDTVESWVARNPNYAMLGDRSVMLGSTEHFHATYGSVFKQIYIDIREMIGYTLYMPVLDMLFATPDDWLEYAIQVETNSPQRSQIFATINARKQTVNTYVVSRITKDLRTGSRDFVSSVSLV